MKKIVYIIFNVRNKKSCVCDRNTLTPQCAKNVKNLKIKSVDVRGWKTSAQKKRGGAIMTPPYVASALSKLTRRTN